MLTKAVIVLCLCSALAAENLEKTQKKELEVQAKAIIAEAKGLEKSGQLAEAREKYAESQALLEINDAANAIKHLDDEIHKRLKDTLIESRKLYDSRKYQEAAAALDEGMKLGAFQPVLTYNLALSYHQLGEHGKAVEYLNKAITGTPDPKQKQRLLQLLTFFITGENGTSINNLDKDRIDQANRLVESVGLDASLEDEVREEQEESFTATDTAATLISPTSLKTSEPAVASTHTTLGRRSSLCTALEVLKDTLPNSPSAIYNRANCAQTNGRPAEAARLLQQYLEVSSGALDAGDVRTRIVELQSLLALPGQNGLEIRRLYASAYGNMAERRYNRALSAFKNAEMLVPDFALNHWKLALLYEAMGDVDLARENFIRYQQFSNEQSARDDAALHLFTLDAKKTKYDEEVGEAEDILSELFNRGMNLTFNLDDNRSAIRAKRARIKKKKDRGKDKNRVGGFAIPYAYAQQELSRASGHLQVALALFPLGAEVNELMGLVFLQANDGHAATKSFDAVASLGLPVSFYAEMRGRRLDHAVKCELTRDRVRLIFLSSYDKKGKPTPPDKQADDDGLGDITLTPTDERQPFDSLDLSLDDIKKVETNKGILTLKLKQQEITLAPIYLPSFTPVEGPPARRFANNYTRLFIRYPGLEDSKLGTEGMSGTEKFVLGYKLATAGFDIASSGFSGIGAIQSMQDVISITRTIRSAMVSLSVSFSSWERSVDDQQQLLAGQKFKPIPTQPVSLVFTQELK